MDESPEAKRKLDLECKKLESEIRNLDQRWWKPAAIQATPGVLLVFLSVFLAWATGVLDARREHLSAQNERLTFQKLKLEADEKAVTSELASLRGELATAKSQRAGLESDRTAIQLLRTSSIDSSIDFDSDTGGYRITLKKPDWNAFQIDAHGNNLDVDPLLKALKTLSKLTKLSSLTLQDLEPKTREFAALRELTTIESLAMVNSGLDDQDMQEFPILPNLKRIRLEREKFSNPGALQKYKTLEVIVIRHTPLDDDGLKLISSLKTTVVAISIEHTKVSDKSADLIAGCDQLTSVHVGASGMTENGILKIATARGLQHLEMEHEQLSQEAYKRLQKERPELQIFRQRALMPSYY